MHFSIARAPCRVLGKECSREVLATGQVLGLPSLAYESGNKIRDNVYQTEKSRLQSTRRKDLLPEFQATAVEVAARPATDTSLRNFVYATGRLLRNFVYLTDT